MNSTWLSNTNIPKKFVCMTYLPNGKRLSNKIKIKSIISNTNNSNAKKIIM
jgi:hypothetical protein